MANRLNELRAKLKQQETTKNVVASDKAVYPFWNIPENSTAVLRFLPDGEEKNDFFWKERLMIRLPFQGVVGKNLDKEVYVQVPCVEMWNESCPVLTQVRPWFKDPNLDEIARKYWKKKSYIFQGFIRSNPIDEQDTPENPIRRMIINPSIFEIIKSALMDPDMEEIPTDYNAGTDFRLTKTMQGNFASYKTSSYSRKSSSLTADEVEAIEKYGLFNLSDFMPKKPGDKELNAIAEMFEASTNGEPYDPNKWAEYYKPSGLDFNTSESNQAVTSRVVSKPVTTPTATKPVQEEVNDDEPPFNVDTTPVVTAKPVITSTSTEGKKSPAEVLAEIKAKAALKQKNG